MSKNLDKAEVGVLTGTAYYTSVHRPAMPPKNNPYDVPPQYTIKLVPDAESAKIIKGYGHELKDPGEKSSIPGPYLEIKNKIYSDVGSKEFDEEVAKKKPDCVDARKKPIPEDILIGNGSKVRVKVGWSFVKQQKKRFPRFWGLQVLDLVKYEKRDEIFTEDKNGYVVGSEQDPNDDI